MINLRLDGTVRTLILTLRARAEEQDHESPILNDPWSAEWNQFMPEDELLDEWYNPAFQLATVVRSRLIDEAVEGFLESAKDPLVIELGAGFSTRYFRVGEGKSTWIDLDLDEAISARRKLDVAVDRHWFVSADMSDLDWVSLLPEYKAKQTLLIAEGALMFLEPEKVEALFEGLREHFKGATFVFDVVNPGYLERANETCATIEAPMLWGVEEKEIKKYGITVKDSRYLLNEYPERWDAIGVESSKRDKERSGYVVMGKLK